MNNGHNYVLRNYDMPPPFNVMASTLTMTIIGPPYESAMANKTAPSPTAMIGIAGQIYCPNCISFDGTFMELNNGMPSGGYEVNETTDTMLIEMLNVMLEGKNYQEIVQELKSKYSSMLVIQ